MMSILGITGTGPSVKKSTKAALGLSSQGWEHGGIYTKLVLFSCAQSVIILDATPPSNRPHYHPYPP